MKLYKNLFNFAEILEKKDVYSLKIKIRKSTKLILSIISRTLCTIGIVKSWRIKSFFSGVF